MSVQEKKKKHRIPIKSQVLGSVFSRRGLHKPHKEERAPKVYFSPPKGRADNNSQTRFR